MTTLQFKNVYVQSSGCAVDVYKRQGYYNEYGEWVEGESY